MARTTPEKIVKIAVDRVLKRHGIWYFKPVSNGMGTHGIPDYICCIPPNGRLLGVECKGKDGLQPTSLQMVQFGLINAHGGLTFIATPGTVAALDVLLTLMKTKPDHDITIDENTNRTDV